MIGLLASRPFAKPPEPEAIPLSTTSGGVGISLARLNCSPLERRPALQPKLTIGKPGDQYEQEADRVAADVVQKMNVAETPSPPPASRSGDEKPMQRQLFLRVGQEDATSSKMPVQRTAAEIQRGQTFHENALRTMRATEANLQASFETRLESARSGGAPLDKAFRAKVEPLMGADFSEVMVHTDAEADQLSRSIHAQAFTTKQDVFFRQGAYEPESQGGQELIAHELTHVVQQEAGRDSSRRLQPDPQFMHVAHDERKTVGKDRQGKKRQERSKGEQESPEIPMLVGQSVSVSNDIQRWEQQEEEEVKQKCTEEKVEYEDFVRYITERNGMPVNDVPIALVGKYIEMYIYELSHDDRFMAIPVLQGGYIVSKSKLDAEALTTVGAVPCVVVGVTHELGVYGLAHIDGGANPELTVKKMIAEVLRHATEIEQREKGKGKEPLINQKLKEQIHLTIGGGNEGKKNFYPPKYEGNLESAIGDIGYNGVDLKAAVKEAFKAQGIKKDNIKEVQKGEDFQIGAYSKEMVGMTQTERLYTEVTSRLEREKAVTPELAKKLSEMLEMLQPQEFAKTKMGKESNEDYEKRLKNIREKLEKIKITSDSVTREKFLAIVEEVYLQNRGMNTVA